MKKNALVGNFGHCNSEMNPSVSEELEGMKVENIMPQSGSVCMWTQPAAREVDGRARCKGGGLLTPCERDSM